MSDIIKKDVPSDYIVFLLANGLLIIFLTPISLLLPILNPLSKSPTEAVGSIALASLFSLVVGFPAFGLRELILGDGGFNNLFKHKFFHGKLLPKPVRLESLDYLRFVVWAKKEKGVSSELSFLALKYAIINGIIVGSEIAIFIDLASMCFMFYLRGIDGLFLTVVLALLSIGIFFITIKLDKEHVRDDYKNRVEAVSILYDEFLKGKQSKTQPTTENK